MEDKKKFVAFRETKPGIIDPLRMTVLKQGLENTKLKFKTLKAGKKDSEYLERVEGFISGFDDACLSAVLGVVFRGAKDINLDEFSSWAFKELFNYLLPGTWDLDYEGLMTLGNFLKEFRLYKKVSTLK